MKRSAALIVLLIVAGAFLSGCTGNVKTVKNTPVSSNAIHQNTSVLKKMESSSYISSKTKVAKNIILLVGDGMGLTQIYVPDRYLEDLYGKHLIIPTIKTRGLITTYSLSSEVTDSAAAATALFSGYKTVNHMINELPNGSIPHKTLGEIFKAEGKSVGIVTTTRLTHATPAGIYAHVKSRYMENEIALQLLKFEPTVALGGGLEYFLPKSMGGKRADGKNLIDAFKAAGYTVVFNRSQLMSVNTEKTKKLLGVFSKSHMAFEVDREHVKSDMDQPSLAEMTEVALKILDKNPKGFFLMVEGGRIDHACHEHDPKAEIMDTIAFDKAVRVALEFQKTHPDTLVIVTADHETGGMSVGRGTFYAANFTALKNINCSISYLDRLIEANPSKTEVEKLIEKLWHTKLSKEEEDLLFSHNLTSRVNDRSILMDFPRVNEYVKNWAGFALAKIESERAKIGWTSFAHTGVPVPVYAVGTDCQLFKGFYDNTGIYTRVLEAAGVLQAVKH